MSEQQSIPIDSQQFVPSAFGDDSLIKLNDKDYRYGDLNDKAKQLIAALQASEIQIQNIRNQLGLMDFGKQALAAQLRLAIENPESLH